MKMTNLNEESFGIDLIPKSLDDVIRRNRDQLKLERVSLNDLVHLNSNLKFTCINGVIQDAFFYKRVISAHPIEHVFLVGFIQNDEGKNAYHTSPIKYFDKQNNAVLTASGSYYLIESYLIGEPKLDFLLHICSVAHRDNWGAFFGVLEVFY